MDLPLDLITRSTLKTMLTVEDVDADLIDNSLDNVIHDMD